jgi:hypothetical protein
MEEHAKIGCLLNEAGLPANHPAMVDWAKVGFRLAELEARLAEVERGEQSAHAAIQYALEDDDMRDFLRYWFEGNFDALRNNWDDVPESVFWADALAGDNAATKVSSDD